MLLTKELTVNLAFRDNPAVLDAVQGDSGRGITMNLVWGETPWSIPEDAGFVLQYRCADGSGGVYDTLPDGTPACTVEENRLKLMLTAQLCAVAGETQLQVTIFSGNVQISAFPVIVRVAPGVTGCEQSSTYVNLQTWLEQAVRQDSFISAVLGIVPDGDEVSY